MLQGNWHDWELLEDGSHPRRLADLVSEEREELVLILAVGLHEALGESLGLGRHRDDGSLARRLLCLELELPLLELKLALLEAEGLELELDVLLCFHFCGPDSHQAGTRAGGALTPGAGGTEADAHAPRVDEEVELAAAKAAHPLGPFDAGCTACVVHGAGRDLALHEGEATATGATERLLGTPGDDVDGGEVCLEGSLEGHDGLLGVRRRGRRGERSREVRDGMGKGDCEAGVGD